MRYSIPKELISPGKVVVSARSRGRGQTFVFCIVFRTLNSIKNHRGRDILGDIMQFLRGKLAVHEVLDLRTGR
jgi:hypothetical protein